jgi:hypothetical protein
MFMTHSILPNAAGHIFVEVHPYPLKVLPIRACCVKKKELSLMLSLFRDVCNQKKKVVCMASMWEDLLVLLHITRWNFSRRVLVFGDL